MFKKFLLMLSFLLIISACTSQSFRHIGSDQFINYGASADFYTVYMGSDLQYHYFAWSDGVSSGRWKIHKDELTVREEHDINKSKVEFVGAITKNILETERFLRNKSSETEH